MRLFVCSERRGPLRGPSPSSFVPSDSGASRSLKGAPADAEGPHPGPWAPFRQVYRVKEVYLLFGQDLRPVGEASAGSVIALSLLPEGGPPGTHPGAPPGAPPGAHLEASLGASSQQGGAQEGAAIPTITGAPMGGAYCMGPPFGCGLGPNDALRDVAAWLQQMKGKGFSGERAFDVWGCWEGLQRQPRLHAAGEGALRSPTLSNDPDCPALVSAYSKVN